MKTYSKSGQFLTIEEIQASYKEWQDWSIGTGKGNLNTEELQKILLEGYLHPDNLGVYASQFPISASNLRRQLGALCGVVKNDEVKLFIRQLCDALPTKFSYPAQSPAK